MKPDQPSSSFPSEEPGEVHSGARARGDESKAAVRETKADPERQASATAANLKERGRGYASEGKQAVAERIGHYGEEIEHAATRFEGEDPNLAWLTHRAANQLNTLAARLRESDIRELWQDAEQIARRHPLAVVGGMFAVGAAVGSFIRSSRPETSGGMSFDPAGVASAGEGFSPREDDLMAPSSGRVTHDF